MTDGQPLTAALLIAVSATFILFQDNAGYLTLYRTNIRLYIFDAAAAPPSHYLVPMKIFYLCRAQDESLSVFMGSMGIDSNNDVCRCQLNPSINPHSSDTGAMDI
ncbi:hypothetical protein ACJJTC_019655 [Scirpophaga incertulas]